MRLLKKLIEDKTKWELFGKKVTTAAVASSIAFSSLFGFMGCGINQNNKNDVDTSIEENQNNSIEELKSVVDSLNSIVSTLNSENKELQEKIETVEKELEEAQNNNEDQDKVIADLTALIAELQKEIESMQEKLDSYENPKDEEMETLTGELAKAKAKLAITTAMDNNYMRVYFDEEIYGECAPNGDVIASRGEYNDYAYYNKSENTLFQSFEGNEYFVSVNYDEDGNCDVTDLDIKAQFIEYFEHDSLIFDKSQSDANKYVFVDDEGYTLTISFENDQLKEVDAELEMKLSVSSKENFETLLTEAKNHLKMIGIYDSYKKEVDASLNYKYKQITGSGNKVRDSIGVFSGKLCATEQKLDVNGEKTLYGLQTEEEQYGCMFDENGDLEKELKLEDKPYDITQVYKESLLLTNGFEDRLKSISYDETSRTYIISSTSDHENGINITMEVKFNEDLSVEIKETLTHNKENVEDEVITFKIEKISKEKFNEIYNRIYNICEQAKEQSNSLSIE